MTLRLYDAIIRYQYTILQRPPWSYLHYALGKREEEDEEELFAARVLPERKRETDIDSERKGEEEGVAGCTVRWGLY